MTMEEVAEDYLRRLRAGECPDIDQYVSSYPALAQEIKETLPVLEAMEQFGLEIEDAEDTGLEWSPLKVDQVGDYRIVGELGRGGMGVVYEAEQQSLRRRVALKVLSRMAGDGNSLARFQREARAAARLHHTNIVPVFQVGQDGEHAYYAMQLIEGQGLDAVIRDLRKLPRPVAFPGNGDKTIEGSSPSSGSFVSKQQDQSEVIRGLADGNAQSVGLRFYRSVAQIGLQAADALSYAHDRGIVHRDVKPSNLLLDPSGVVWVSDFGLAMTDEGQLTRTDDVVGTLRYMSPERFQNQCDSRADIYSLGMTLYELLVMEPAFRMVNRLNLIKSIINDDPPSPRQYDSQIPRDLETILLKSIEKEPRSRYTSAAAMANDLRHFLNDDPIEARRASAREKFVRWSRRNKSLAASLLAIAALLSTLLVVLSWTSFQQNNLLAQQENLLELAEQRGKSLQDNLYFAQMNLAGQAVSQRFGTDTIRAQLKKWNPDLVQRDLRDWEWYYLYGVSHAAEYVSEPLGNGFCWACDHSPDGDFVVNTKNGWGVQVRDALSGNVVIDRWLGSARSVDWSPDGEKIAVGQFSDTCAVLDAKTLNTLREFKLSNGGEGWCVRWHPNSRWLAEVREHTDTQEKRKVRIHDIETGKLLWELNHPGASPRILAWHPDGSKLAASGSSQTVVWTFHSQQPRVESVIDGTRAQWSPDGSVLAANRKDGIWDALSNKQLADSMGSISWSPDSKKLAVGCSDGIIRIHNASSAGLHPEREMRGHTSEIWSVSWSRDGERIASCGLRDETFRLWKVDQTDQTQFIGRPGVQILELSGNGQTLVSTGYYNTEVIVWDINGNPHARRNFNSQVLRFAPNHSGDIVAVFSESQKLVLWQPAKDSVREICAECEFSYLAWSPKGQLAATTRTGEIIIWDHECERVREIKNEHEYGAIVHWNADGRQLVSCSNDSLKLWNIPTGKLTWEVASIGLETNDVRFSGDGSRIATAHLGAIYIWDAKTGEKLDTLSQIRENFVSLDWKSDDSRIVSGSGASVAFWDVASGAIALRVDGPRRLNTVRWAADGMRVAASGETIVVFDASRGYTLNTQGGGDSSESQSLSSESFP
ncbi:MAG: WD40 repeat domain-containing serine/threonine protein kinase [Planctomycetota bacterium]